MRRLISLSVFLPLLSLLLGTPCHSLTVSDLRTQARILALDAGSSRNRFADARILDFLNEGQRQVNLDVKPIIKQTSFDLTSGATFYATATDFLQMYHLTSDYEALPEITPEALDKSSNWEEVDGEPTNYFIRWSSRTMIGFYPFPDSTSSTTTIRYEYIAQSTDLSADTDIPFGGIRELYPYHYALAYFAAYKMAAIDGRTDLATLYMAEFRAAVERMSRESKNRPVYRPSATGRQ